MLIRSSFLKTGVTHANSISEGNLPNGNDLLNSWCKSVKMSKLSLTIFVGMSDFGGIWRNQTFLIISISVGVTLLKQKVLLAEYSEGF